jgi:hypothetical protein
VSGEYAEICAGIEHGKGDRISCRAETPEAVTLEKPLPDDALRIVQEARKTARRSRWKGSSREAFHGDGLDRRDEPRRHMAKTIAERAAWAWHKAEGGGLELVAVNPTWFSGRISRLRLRRLGSSWTAGTLQAVTVALAQPGSLCLGAQSQYHSPR